MDTFFLEGARVWHRHKEQLLPATVSSCNDSSLVLTTDYGKVMHLQREELNRETVYLMHPSSIHGVEDMSTLAELHEAAIMHNLFLRYKKDNIYTNIGSILAAVNPYKQITGLYDAAAVALYSKHQMGELPPHIFAVANECYRCLWKRHDSQCVLISGESGAGKTESTKLLLKFLSCDESKLCRYSSLREDQQGGAGPGPEQNRVVRQNPGERNYHIFYALLAGTDNNHRDMYLLSEGAESYHYLSQSGCVQDNSLDDKQLFDSVMEALKVMEFTEEEIRDMFKLLSAVLQMGNIEFMTAGGAQITSKGVVSNVSELLGLDSFQLSEVLTQRSMILRGEEICSPLTVEQAVDSRDSVAMALYSQCFSWIIMKINQKIKGKENFKSIGILDIFGFENFEKLGMLALINEESRFPKGTDYTLLEKLHSRHATNPYYVKPRVNDHQFGIKHYAGEVLYDVCGILEKNRDTFRDDILFILKDSRLDFIYDLFEHVGSRSGDETLKMGTARRKPTVSSQFRDSLHSLMATLSASNPFFVRCIKPNMDKKANQFDSDVVLNQLRYSGMLETVKIRRAGFPVRRTFRDFYSRYKIILKIKIHSDDEKQCCSDLLTLQDKDKQEWHLGKTKVFLKEALEQRLEKEREEVRHRAGMVIRAHILSYVARKQYKRILSSIVTIQKNYRTHFWRRKFLRLRLATIVLQKHYRGRSGRFLYRCLREQKQKRDEEEKRRREEEEQERRLEEERRRMEEERRQQEVEEKRKREEEEERQRLLHEEMEKREEELRLMKEEEQKMAANTNEKSSSLVNGVCQKSQALSSSHSSEEESRQMEEILRLEREIERLQKQQEDSMSLLGDVPKEELRKMRDAEIYRLEKEASRVATEFLDLLDFGGLEPSLSSEENLHDPTESTAPLAEEEVDEGFPAEDECIPLPDFPPLAKVPLAKDVLQSIPPPPPAFAEGQVDAPSSSKLSPLTPNGHPQTSRPPAPPAVVTNGKKQAHGSSRGSDLEHATEEPSHPIMPDAESDYDQEEFEEAHGSSGGQYQRWQYHR
ncbi:hypothetical protein fugu_000119 [Takifugu bimaculatus]|uniref:Myosin motor domain-containing protein n=1 Tax=Takifugu bimaculatus TaxID=433685 RepID=A0A4Z2CG24_9TELE|nr:hypothetical protein fugu_000119 [Takifugu bimaculatus]